VSVPTLEALLGAKETVTVGGKAVKLRPAKLNEQLAFSTFLKDRARREASAVDPQTPPEAADRMMRAVMRDINEGHYGVDGEGYVAAMRTPEGLCEFLSIVLRADNPWVTRDDVRGLIENGLREAYLQVLQLEGADPFVLRAVSAALGFPENWLTSSGSSSSASATPHSPTPPGPSAS
jgi:hypothetical protein